MRKLIAFAGSSSTTSINKQLAIYAASLFDDVEVEILDLNDYALPLFSVDLEKHLEKPLIARTFMNKLAFAEIIVLSLAEHNATFSTAFKNIFDWASRQDKTVFAHTPMLLLATSPGNGGGRNVIEAAKVSLPKYGANIKTTFFMPRFTENFDVEQKRITNAEYDQDLRNKIKNFNYNR